MTSKILRNDQNIYSSMYVCIHTIPDSRKEELSGMVGTPIRYATLHFRDWYAVASLRYGNRAVWFWCRRESYLV